MIVHFSLYIDPRSTRRIDTFLVSLFPDFSRSQVQKIIEVGRVKINGKVITKNAKLHPRDEVWADFTPEKNGKFEAENIPLDIVFENMDFAIINKDPFMSVHPASYVESKSGTLVNALLYHFWSLSVIGGIERPGIAHRLDKDTSWVIFIAKNDRSMRLFQRRIQDRKIQKTYLAVTVGIPKEREGYIESYIGRDPNDRKKMTAINPINPKLAKTKFKVLGTMEGKYALLEVDLLTGRTHQIRVHLSSIGFPIIGDQTYGRSKANAEAEEKYGLKRQWLHAYQIEFDLFHTRYTFNAAVKPDLLAFSNVRDMGEFGVNHVKKIRYNIDSKNIQWISNEDDTEGECSEKEKEDIFEDEE